MFFTQASEGINHILTLETNFRISFVLCDKVENYGTKRLVTDDNNI
jgi:hypothetical protein